MRDQPSPALPSSDTSVPPGLLEALARAVVAALSPPPPVPGSAEDAADFLTAVSSRGGWGFRGRRCGGWRSPGAAAHGGVPGSQADHAPVPAPVRRRLRGQRNDVADLAGFAERWRARVAGAA